MIKRDETKKKKIQTYKCGTGKLHNVIGGSEKSKIISGGDLSASFYEDFFQIFASAAQDRNVTKTFPFNGFVSFHWPVGK